MILLVAVRAEVKLASGALTLLLVAIDLGWRVALRAPPEVFHLVYGFGDTVSCVLVDQLIGKLEGNEVLLPDESRAGLV